MSSNSVDRPAEERLRKEVEAGDFKAVIDTFALVRSGQIGLPDWLLEPVAKALEFTFEKRGAPGDRMKSGQKAMHMQRHALVQFWLSNREMLPELGYPATREGVFAMIADGEVMVTPKAIQHSYERVRRLQRPQNSGE